MGGEIDPSLTCLHPLLSLRMQCNCNELKKQPPMINNNNINNSTSPRGMADTTTRVTTKVHRTLARAITNEEDKLDDVQICCNRFNHPREGPLHISKSRGIFATDRRVIYEFIVLNNWVPICCDQFYVVYITPVSYTHLTLPTTPYV